MKDFEKQEKAFENEIADRYNDDYHTSIIMKEHDNDFARYVSRVVTENDRVLDLGCGPASLWKLWTKELPKCQRLVGVDLSDEMIKIAKKNWPDNEFFSSSIFDLPFESGSFDVVIVSSVLHHIPDENLNEVFKEIFRVLDEHGKVVGREPVGINTLSNKSGWFSGAIMHLRHLIFRLTNTREYPEPDIGEYHHAYDPEVFFNALSSLFLIKGIEFKYPFSDYVTRCNDENVFKIVKYLDDIIKKNGQEFYYSAHKNFSDVDDVKFCVEQVIKEITKFIMNSKLMLIFRQQQKLSIIYGKNNIR
ncbi:MAG: class I SAM-dependent methyltransferase [Candidatus Gracilibacteria bacterium]|nr:class I SAM-dependent methyltransferase [Candidatus Gracilibacteria bacterium]